MKFKTMFAVGSFAFTIWRGYRNLKSSVRTQARSKLKRAYKAV